VGGTDVILTMSKNDTFSVTWRKLNGHENIFRNSKKIPKKIKEIECRGKDNVSFSNVS